MAHFDRMRMGHFAFGLEGVSTVVDFTDALMLYLERTGTERRTWSGRLVDAWERRTIPAYERKLLENIDAGLCCSTIDQEFFHRHHPSHRVEMICNTVDSDHFRPQDPGTPRLVFTGTFSYFPNIDSLFYFMEQWWPTVHERYPQLQLDVIGARPPEKVLALDSQPGVRVLSDVPDMADHLRSGDIFICPLRVASGMRNKVLEAMAAGMTVISTPIGVEGLGVQRDRHYLEAGSLEQFMAQLERALKTPEIRRTLGEQARMYVVEHHSGESADLALVQLYEWVIAERSIPVA